MLTVLVVLAMLVAPVMLVALVTLVVLALLVVLVVILETQAQNAGLDGRLDGWDGIPRTLGKDLRGTQDQISPAFKAWI